MLQSDEAIRLLRAIAELSGASYSEEDTGAETCVTIRYKGDGIRTGRPASIIHSSDTKLHVLHIEDGDNASDLIHYYLHRTCHVEAAADATEALQMAMEKQYDYILMDIDLGPGMNGLELTGVLRKSARYQKTPIIAITGHTTKGDMKRCLAAGCSAYLSKPFLKEDLLLVMRELMPKAA